jgi:hypothetical protein
VIDTSQLSPQNRRATVALVPASVSLVLSVFSCGLAVLTLSAAHVDLLPVQSKPEAASVSQVAAVAQVTLPPGTVFLAAAYSNGLETRLSAKFAFPARGSTRLSRPEGSPLR